jgi:hypothetical protein
MKPISFAADRSISVPAGHLVRTGYVEIHKVRLACRERMAVGDVDRAFQKRLQLGTDQPFPCPNGIWDEDGWFVIYDGRHEFVACLMLGLTHLLVAWVEPVPREGMSSELSTPR